MNALLTKLNSILQLNPSIQEDLSTRFTKIEIQKGDYLLREGTVCRNMYFLERGSLRAYYHLEGKEITHWFAFENDFVTSFHSFITQKASVESLQSLEDSLLWSISHDVLYSLYDQYSEVERLGRMVCEQYYIRLEERYVNSQFRTAADRYNELIHTKPDLLQRVSLGYLASYLGISQETLSRIRSKRT